MKKCVHTIVAFMLTAVMLFSTSASVLAADQNNTLKEMPSLTQIQKNALNKWVGYDKAQNEYFIKNGAKDELFSSDYKLLESCLDITNANISRSDFSSGEVFVVSPSDEGRIFPTARLGGGVTKIQFHWWGATIYLSKTTINTMGAGITVGGIWIPEPVVSKIAATLGVVITLCPGGIVFDYNYIAAGIDHFVPGVGLVFPAVSNIRWQ